MAELSFRYEPYDDWHCKLVAVVEANGFRGEGEAYFSHHDVRRFVDRASHYPLSPTDLPQLIYCLDHEVISNTLPRTFGITFSPYDNKGTLRADIALASQDFDPIGKALQNAVVVRFLLTYNDLLELQSLLPLIVEDKVGQVSLRSTYSH